MFIKTFKKQVKSVECTNRFIKYFLRVHLGFSFFWPLFLRFVATQEIWHTIDGAEYDTEFFRGGVGWEMQMNTNKIPQAEKIMPGIKIN